MTPLSINQEELEAQLVLLFYGADALQDYRKDRTLPVTVYQACRLLTTSMTALLDEAIGKKITQYLPAHGGTDFPGPYLKGEVVPVSVLEQLKKEVANGSNLSDKTIARVQIDTLEALLPMAEPNSNVVTTSTIRFVIDGCKERISHGA